MSVTYEEARLISQFETASLAAASAALTVTSVDVAEASPKKGSSSVELPLIKVNQPIPSSKYHDMQRLWQRAYLRLATPWSDEGGATTASFFPEVSSINAGFPASYELSLIAADRLIREKEMADQFNVNIVGPLSLSLTDHTNTVVADPLGMANFMREYGTRLYNAEKNTGVARFAFNTFQRSFFPPEYRCPVSVIGGGET
jgi:hypothetical protein